jgi:hypothetical protein
MSMSHTPHCIAGGRNCRNRRRPQSRSYDGDECMAVISSDCAEFIDKNRISVVNFLSQHGYGRDKVRARMRDINWHLLSSAALMRVQCMMLPPAAACVQAAALR